MFSSNILVAGVGAGVIHFIHLLSFLGVGVGVRHALFGRVLGSYIQNLII